MILNNDLDDYLNAQKYRKKKSENVHHTHCLILISFTHTIKNNHIFLCATDVIILFVAKNTIITIAANKMFKERVNISSVGHFYFDMFFAHMHYRFKKYMKFHSIAKINIVISIK